MHKIIKKFWLPPSPALFVGAASGGGGSGGVIFTPSSGMTSSDTNTGIIFRVVATLAEASIGNLKFSFKAAPGTGLQVTGAAFGKSNGTASETTSTPIAMTFGGGAGFSIAAGASQTSDTMSHSGLSFAASDKIVVSFQVTTPGGTAFGNSNSNADTYYRPSVDSTWSEAAPSGYTTSLGNCWGLTMIETL